MSSAKEKANLARIRDNQRRSRARRKEYLQELEARLRQCELQGIEASSEIQMAARRVADENKKLRGLLAQHGVADDNIEAYLQTSPTTDGMAGGPYTSSSGAVQLLEQLLQTRKTCCADGNNPVLGQGTGSRDSSTSVTTVQSLWDPVYAQNPGRAGSLQQTGKAASSAHQFMTPSTSSASRTSSVSHGPASHHQRLALGQIPRSPASNPSSHSQHQHLFDFDPQISVSGSYSSHQSHTHKHLQPHSGAQRSSVYISHPPTNTNVNNCNYAAEMITTMAGADPSTVRADLGCLPGMECDVDNHHLFEVMDRYSGVGL
ncbi:uncharacterized protein LY89DRAFT_77292 [Mollisia scopiformis]|uniref:BZIP domain-containing protein n=1 Tax=Mollisia scopiformis TaxID=149040 RepID=A0A194X7R4_MOLSC|nr:uncharacterized protein LY89DRAFT_77292 [Mollisia scopiformis]KUJ16208.1 hypothetical protein LY89DRAFT_77292 [Mollisia scopiformis]